MTSFVPTTPTTDAVVARLETSGLLIGDGRAPLDGGWQGAAGQSEFVPYVVLYTLGAKREGPDASIADRQDAPQLLYQTSAVGADRQQAEVAADLAARVLLTNTMLDIDGRSTVLLVHELNVPAQPDETVNPPVFLAVDRYRVDTSV